jgi:hypothetical protein
MHSPKVSELTDGRDYVSLPFFVAKALQAELCLHNATFAGRKNNEKQSFEVFVCVNRVGASLLD